MAKLMLIGKIAHVQLRHDPEDGQIIATCEEHAPGPNGFPAESCMWSERYDDLRDAAEYAQDHADEGR